MKKKRLLSSYRGLELDSFQQSAFFYLEQETSLLVCAPTGTGKTLIADFLIDKALKTSLRVLYTAPIKALVNQKYGEFANRFGSRSIGMATGDITILPDASILIVTTEIFRNMLRIKDSRIENLDWVIFDEIHYLDHKERGTVWEESILLKPRSTKMLGLSATIPNLEEIASWIEAIHKEPLAIVSYTERAVPLEHSYFNQAGGKFPHQALKQKFAEATLSKQDAYDFKGGHLSLEDIFLPKNVVYQETTEYLDLVYYVARTKGFPLLFFSFSRRGCEFKAREVAKRRDYLSFQQKQRVQYEVHRILTKHKIKKEEIPGFATYYEQWHRGIGIHHAGLLPIVKKIAETLLQEGLLQLLFATETFAVGINMPVRTVCFDGLKKFDGKTIRYLTQQEYFQMAGRAGRRGHDRFGSVISLLNFSSIAKDPLPNWGEGTLEPIESRLSLSFNMVLNLVKHFQEEEIDALLKKSFGSYKNEAHWEFLKEEFRQKKDTLERLGFLQQQALTKKGELGARLYVKELLLAETLSLGLFESFTLEQIGGATASIAYDLRQELPRRAYDSYLHPLEGIQEKLSRQSGLSPMLIGTLHQEAAALVVSWMKGRDLKELLKEFSLDAGDFVQVCRSTIDILNQVRAIASPVLACTINGVLEKLDRGVVKVRF